MYKLFCFVHPGEYSTCLQEHMYIEPQAALVVPKIENNEIDVYCASHGISGIQVVTGSENTL